MSVTTTETPTVTIDEAEYSYFKEELEECEDAIEDLECALDNVRSEWTAIGERMVMLAEREPLTHPEWRLLISDMRELLGLPPTVRP